MIGICLGGGRRLWKAGTWCWSPEQSKEDRGGGRCTAVMGDGLHLGLVKEDLLLKGIKCMQRNKTSINPVILGWS